MEGKEIFDRIITLQNKAEKERSKEKQHNIIARQYEEEIADLISRLRLEEKKDKKTYM